MRFASCHLVPSCCRFIYNLFPVSRRLWWSPDPRLILFPVALKVSRSLRQTIKKGIYRVTTNAALEDVIKSCATITRKGERRLDNR